MQCSEPCLQLPDAGVVLQHRILAFCSPALGCNFCHICCQQPVCRKQHITCRQSHMRDSILDKWCSKLQRPRAHFPNSMAISPPVTRVVFPLLLLVLVLLNIVPLIICVSIVGFCDRGWAGLPALALAPCMQRQRIPCTALSRSERPFIVLKRQRKNPLEPA